MTNTDKAATTIYFETMSKMELAEQIGPLIPSYLPSDLEGAETRVVKAAKTNTTLTSIVVLIPGRDMSLMSYVDDLYEPVISGKMTIYEVARKIADAVTLAVRNKRDIDSSLC